MTDPDHDPVDRQLLAEIEGALEGPRHERNAQLLESAMAQVREEDQLERALVAEASPAQRPAVEALVAALNDIDALVAARCLRAASAGSNGIWKETERLEEIVREPAAELDRREAQAEQRRNEDLLAPPPSRMIPTHSERVERIAAEAAAAHEEIQ